MGRDGRSGAHRAGDRGGSTLDVPFSVRRDGPRWRTFVLVSTRVYVASPDARADLSAAAQAIAEAVGGDGELLACLHLLVQADASACKEEAWDAWKAGLVDVLVHRAQAAIA